MIYMFVETIHPRQSGICDTQFKCVRDLRTYETVYIQLVLGLCACSVAAIATCTLSTVRPWALHSLLFAVNCDQMAEWLSVLLLLL